MLNTNKKYKIENPSDCIYDLGYYNSQGIINRLKLNSHIFFIVFIVFSIGIFVQYFIDYILYFEKVFSYKELLNIIVEVSIDFHKRNSIVIQSFLYEENFIFPKIYIKYISICFFISLCSITLLVYSVMKKSRFQASLSSVGLSQYYFYKRNKNTIFLKFKKGQKNQYKNFSVQKDNLIQVLGVSNLKFCRWSKNGIKLKITDPFPTIEDLSNLKVNNFLEKGKLFLGISLVEADEVIEKKDLINGKYVARYISFENLPHSLANLGSAGGGKSNTMNQYLFSIFYNFEYIEDFYFIDFKGGLEAQPFLDLEVKYQTKRIHIYDDDRLSLYKILKKLYIVNKARMAYLKANKKKKLTSNFIFIVFDEMAEVLDYTTATKEEKFIKEQILFYFESLIRTMRSQAIVILYSTQSYLSNASGLSSAVKNSTILKVAHQLGSKMQTSSIKDSEELIERGIDDPTTYDIGRNLIINESNNTYLEVRSLYVPEDFIDNIEINVNKDKSFEDFMEIFYYETIKKFENELIEDSIYPLTELVKDLGISYDIKQEEIIENKSNKDNNIEPIKKETEDKKKSFQDIKKVNNLKKTTEKKSFENLFEINK